MPDGRLHLDPYQAGDGARNLAAAGADLRAQLQGPGAEIAAATARPPWGCDEIGAAFDRQYRPLEQNMLLAWEKLAAFVAGLGDAAALSVRANLDADAGAAGRVQQAGKST